MIGPLLEALRPRQWTKNLLVFAGVLFSQQMGEGSLVLRAAGGFVAFSLFSSFVYLLNDLRDVEADRQHPRKSRRPIASGRLTPAAAKVAMVPLLAVALALGAWLGRDFLLVVLLYLVTNVAYTFALKNQVLIDVFVIASGFVMRAIAGVELLKPVSPATTLSPWLLVCTFFGALFLSLGKRKRELVNAGAEAGSRRRVFDHYTPELLDGLLLISASNSVIGYALYTIWPTTVAKFGTESLLYTVPLVTYGIFRYLYLVRASETAEDPSQVLLTDRPIAATVVLYLALVIAILYRP